MTVQEIGNGLVALCREGKLEEATHAYYDENILSVEPEGENRESRGLAAIKAKGEWWNSNFTTNRIEVQGPYPHGDQFAVRFLFDVTSKANNQPMTIDEVGLYTVKNDKIVEERFFYTMG